LSSAVDRTISFCKQLTWRKFLAYTVALIVCSFAVLSQSASGFKFIPALITLLALPFSIPTFIVFGLCILSAISGFTHTYGTYWEACRDWGLQRFKVIKDLPDTHPLRLRGKGGELGSLEHAALECDRLKIENARLLELILQYTSESSACESDVLTEVSDSDEAPDLIPEASAESPAIPAPQPSASKPPLTRGQSFLNILKKIHQYAVWIFAGLIVLTGALVGLGSSALGIQSLILAFGLFLGANFPLVLVIGISVLIGVCAQFCKLVLSGERQFSILAILFGVHMKNTGHDRNLELYRRLLADIDQFQKHNKVLKLELEQHELAHQESDGRSLIQSEYALGFRQMRLFEHVILRGRPERDFPEEPHVFESEGFSAPAPALM
jgi:hypothetical protein